MGMKATQEQPREPGTFYVGGPVINLVGSELEIEAVENGYQVRTMEYVKDSDGDNTRKYRRYVFNDSTEMLKAIDFWTKKQEVSK